MQKKTYITDLKQGQNIEDLFVIAESRLAQSKNGPYWDLRLQDSSGRLEAKIWPPLSNEFAELEVGQGALITGQVRSFKENLQLVVKNLQVIDLQAQGLDLSWFIPRSEREPKDILVELEGLCKAELRHPAWRKLSKSVLKDPEIRERLLRAPGAKSIHHAYVGGLLEHTLQVAKNCLCLSQQYNELDQEILLVAALFHDLGKAWELEGLISADYSDSGRLLGHIVITLEVLEPFLQKVELSSELKLHLKHLIVSHHGEYEYGSPKRPKTREALVLHYADMLDSKLKAAENALKDVEQEKGWSQYQRFMQRYIYKAEITPASEERSRVKLQGTGKGKKKLQEQQCLLPLKE